MKTDCVELFSYGFTMLTSFIISFLFREQQFNTTEEGRSGKLVCQTGKYSSLPSHIKTITV